MWILRFTDGRRSKRGLEPTELARICVGVREVELIVLSAQGDQILRTQNVPFDIYSRTGPLAVDF